MDKGAFHPLDTSVGTGGRHPESPAFVSSLPAAPRGLAPALLPVSPSGGTSRMVIRALPAEVLTTNAYCTTCLRTRRFHVRPTHLLCETCSKRLERVSPDRGTRMTG